MYFLLFLAGLVSAFLLMMILSALRRRKRRKFKGGKVVQIDTFMKLITFLVISHGLVMITFSYILAWFDKDPVVNVSVTLITEVVAPVVTYIASNTIMNIFEKNELKFSTPISSLNLRKSNSNDGSDAAG